MREPSAARWATRRKFKIPQLRAGVPFLVFTGVIALVLGFSVYGAPGIVGLAAGDIAGRATVIDGDTIAIHGQRIRFNGIDAPEADQTCNDADGRKYRCGSIAAKALDAYLARSRPTRCEFVEWDQFRRFVGDCYRADGENVASWLVRNGHAMDWPRYSSGRFAPEEQAARKERRGIWQGSFVAPWTWRRERRDDNLQPSAEEGRWSRSPPGRLSCNIKGNISRGGKRIYHVPGQRDYEETRISRTRGERWFCSEAEAQAAGWRRSRN